MYIYIYIVYIPHWSPFLTAGLLRTSENASQNSPSREPSLGVYVILSSQIALIWPSAELTEFSHAGDQVTWIPWFFLVVNRC